MKVFPLLIILEILFGYDSSEVEVESFLENPSMYPGHMEPLGSKQPQIEIETLYEYPNAQDFFKDYVKPGRPFLLKKGAVNQPAFKLWSDDYMKSFPEAATEQVACEPNLKEIREAQGFYTSMLDFINRYHKEEIYMVSKVPDYLQKDILMPPPLRCNNTRKLMLDHVTWMSSGGTKSVLHNDDLDNINCLFRGTKELLFINPVKYGKKVPIDRPRGGYSSLDVDKVNFTKYPALREVEYIHCTMEEGDCLFIPWRWYHQVNSISNKNSQNIAVNIWFTHDDQHIPEQCDVDDGKTSINNWVFSGIESYASEVNESVSTYPLIDVVKSLIQKTKYQRINFKTFFTLLHKVPGIFSGEEFDHLKLPVEFVKACKETFDKINVVEDKYIDSKDFEKISSDELSENIEASIGKHFETMVNIVNELLTQESLVGSTEENNNDDKEKIIPDYENVAKSNDKVEL
ncbi:uncharacterized protein LOC100207979 isoform X3 [Hydra vulgaris]|uniref:Uncharacterized protein LOC100207979 isoform X3 n=1 Tax=Hydra vulgaris TaxID=6087 RepID=A0ABM4BIJ1_HYDVU